MKNRKALIWILTIVFCVSIVPFSAGAIYEPIADVNTISINDLENNPDVTVSEPMTFTESVERFAENANISFQEAYDALGGNARSVQPRDVHYRVLSVNLHVTDSYIPHLEFYCETAEGGHFYQLISIYSVQLVREYNNRSKQFEGDIQVWLRQGSNIEYVVNGDFYDNGTTSVSGGVNINLGVDDKCTISFNISYSSNHYKYFYRHNTFHWGNV